MAAGDEITVPRGSAGNLGTLGADTPMLITSDGGSRYVGGHQAAAGAAIAWAREERGWSRRETRTWGNPRGANSVLAEGWAARMAMELAD
eukprot:2218754-Lingulodinium_polyedra.AAC.1